MLKCDNCGTVFDESEADSRWSQLGDSLPPGVKICVCPECGGEDFEDYYKNDEEDENNEA